MAEVAYDMIQPSYSGVPTMSADTESVTVPAPDDVITIETRFGLLSFTAAQTLDMPQGLFGFADKRGFGLANLPTDPDSQFKVLQSLDDGTLSFIVLPIAKDGGLIDAADLDMACDDVGVLPEQAAFLLIVTIRKLPEGVKLTCNLQAPLVIDTTARKAYQHVLQDSRYAVQHPL